MSTPTIDLAETKARLIADQYQVQHLPINVDKVLEGFDISITYDSFEKFGALIDKIDDRILMIVNKNCPYPQRRFHIAHEIGHLILGHEGNFFQSIMQAQQAYNKSLDEQCADAFASELLIPSTKLRRLGFKNEFNVQKLKKLFCVSEYAMAYKLYLLDLPYKNTRYDFF